jgi:hypothetical protein
MQTFEQWIIYFFYNGKGTVFLAIIFVFETLHFGKSCGCRFSFELGMKEF